MIRFFNAFVKITGFLPQLLVFRTKVLYENKAAQSRRIKGNAIIISNHTSVWDYAAFLFVFFSRTLRYQMAELLFKKKLLGWFLRSMGGIYVNRDTHDFSFMAKSEEILSAGGVVGIFPESRLPREGEARPLPFVPSAAYLALHSGAKVIPVYTNGKYFTRERAKVVIGEPIDVSMLYDEGISEKENLRKITETLRERVISLGKRIDEEG